MCLLPRCHGPASRGQASMCRASAPAARRTACCRGLGPGRDSNRLAWRSSDSGRSQAVAALDQVGPVRGRQTAQHAVPACSAGRPPLRRPQGTPGSGGTRRRRCYLGVRCYLGDLVIWVSACLRGAVPGCGPERRLVRCRYACNIGSIGFEASNLKLMKRPEHIGPKDLTFDFRGIHSQMPTNDRNSIY